MTDSPDPEAAPAPRPVDGSVSADATNRVQVEAMQALLVRMLQDVIDGETLAGRTRAEALVEANERLLLTALQSQADADAARQALHRVTQSARTDSLTGLPNRATLLDLLQNRRSLRVEWYIVILIVVEIVLTLYELFVRAH